MWIVVVTPAGSPSNDGIFADWSALTMQLPVAVPMKGPPCKAALVTRPEGA